jgi:hypothetical protein
MECKNNFCSFSIKVHTAGPSLKRVTIAHIIMPLLATMEANG